MKRYRRFARALMDALERCGRTRVLRALEGMDPDFLRERGYSMALLRKGLAGWPWRVEQVSETDEVPAVDTLSLAEAELSEYSDAQLDDLGISRHEIPNAVRYGRPGIEDVAA